MSLIFLVTINFRLFLTDLGIDSEALAYDKGKLPLCLPAF